MIVWVFEKQSTALKMKETPAYVALCELAGN